MEEPLLIHPSKKSTQGGVRTLPFILANEGFERAAFYGLQPNMIVYIMSAYGLEMAIGANIIFLWSAATNLTPIICAFLADSYVGRFRMIGLGSISSLLGMTLLWSTTIIPGVRPSQITSENSSAASSSTPFHLIYFCSSLALMSIGSGGIRSSSLAFGADQLTCSGDDENAKPDCGGVLESFFNWYYFSITVAMLFAMTCVVYIQDHMGWQVGFAVPVTLMLVSVTSFYLASSFYVKPKPKASLLTKFAQVVVASWRNRHYNVSSHLNTEEVFHVPKGSVLEVPSDKLRFLNKACIIKDHRQDLTQDETVVDPWRLCTTDQVEEFKSIINIMPLWSTGIMFCAAASQGSFMLIQLESMDRHILTPSFEIPPGSFGTFALVTVMLWLVIYNRVIIPLATRVMGKPIRIDVRLRMGIGLLFSFLSMVVAGVVEHARRSKATNAGVSMHDVAPSAMWLVPQVCLLGLGEAFTAIAQIEFFYSEFPRSMSSIASNLYGLSYSIGSVAASFIMTVVDCATGGDTKTSWVSSDPNSGHYDYYYWLIASLSLVNFFYFLLCNRAYMMGKRVTKDQQEITGSV